MDHEDSLSTVFSTDIRPLIDVIDTLRKIGIQQYIPLPNVVVVGDQSSGKSSIIEALSGVQLPRGKGIVTRCPLELQLMRVLNSPWVAKLSYQSSGGESIAHNIDTPESVEEYIRQAQDNICGVGKGVSDQIITLRIESPALNAPDLTLIDLPGIARIALADQDKNICEQIRRMIMGYVRPKNTVILCVISAFLDIAVNESINIANEVDSVGERTIGVVTKPDLADETQKKEVLCILNHERIKLAKGFSMVKCRSQKELEEKLSLENSMLKEKEYFENDEIYRNADRSQLGIMNLASKISEELVGVIKTSLPQLKISIETSLIDTQQKLDHLPDGIPESLQEKRTYLSKNIWSLNTDIKKYLNQGSCCTEETNLYFTWRQFSTIFSQSVINKNKDAMQMQFSLENLKTKISNSRGREISSFFNFELFENLVTSLIATYEADARILAKSVNQLIEKSILTLIENTFKHISEIERDLKCILKQRSVDVLKMTYKKIDFVFKQERLAFTMDNNFEKNLEEVQKKEMETPKSCFKSTTNLEFMSEFNKGSAKSMQEMIKIYIKIVTQRLCDVIPMTINHCSITMLFKDLSQSFLEFATSSGVENKITENRKIREERRNLLDKVVRLQKAQANLIRF